MENRALQGRCSRGAASVMRSAALVPVLPVLLEGMKKEVSMRPDCGADQVAWLVFVGAGC